MPNFPEPDKEGNDFATVTIVAQEAESTSLLWRKAGPCGVEEVSTGRSYGKHLHVPNQVLVARGPSIPKADPHYETE